MVREEVSQGELGAVQAVALGKATQPSACVSSSQNVV